MTTATTGTAMRSVGWLMVWFVASCGFPRPAEVPATQIVLTSGDSQTGTAGSELAAPLVVTAEDAHGNPIAGVTVAFNVIAGGGVLSTASVATDEQGQAQTTLTLGTTSGTNTVQASATDLTGSPISFTATGAAGPANHIVLTSGNNQIGTSGSALASPFVVTVDDANHNPIPGFSVDFVVTVGDAIVSVPTVTTDALGRAQTVGTLGAVSGTTKVEARGAGLSGSPVVFTATMASFAAKVDFPTGFVPVSVALGDINGDGKLDLVVANISSSTVSVLLNTTTLGATTPSFAGKVDFPTGAGVRSVAVGDLNGDGKLDVAVGNTTDSTVSVLLNTTAVGAATPSFAAKVDFQTGAGTRGVAIGDLNGDGSLDLAAVAANSAAVSILLNTTLVGATTPSFSAKVDFPTGTNPIPVAIGDFNGDAKLDLAVANNNGASSKTVSVLLNTTPTGATTPSFAAKVDFTTGTSPSSVALGDVDGNGKLDLAIGNSTGPYTVSALLNTTVTAAVVPSFAVKVDFPTGTQPSVALGDVNGDGRPDLAAANSGDSTVSVLLNTSVVATSSFAAKVDFSTGAGPSSVAIGDLNGDGRPDLAVANASGASVSVLLSQ